MNYQEKRAKMQELTGKLNEASRAYYAEDKEIISNLEYDRLYDELQALEKETGVVLAGSPTVKVGFEAVEELPKERHERPMLSLDKTKDREELAEWLQGKEGLLSWKLAEGAFVMEAGRADDCADLSGRKAFKGSHPGKR